MGLNLVHELILVRAVGCATALALTGVLAFTAVVAGLAATLAFAGILSRTRMLLYLFVGKGNPSGLSQRTSRRQSRTRVARHGNACVQPGHGATQKASKGRCQYQRTLGNFHGLRFSFSSC